MVEGLRRVAVCCFHLLTEVLQQRYLVLFLLGATHLVYFLLLGSLREFLKEIHDLFIFLLLLPELFRAVPVDVLEPGHLSTKHLLEVRAVIKKRVGQHGDPRESFEFFEAQKKLKELLVVLRVEADSVVGEVQLNEAVLQAEELPSRDLFDLVRSQVQLHKLRRSGKIRHLAKVVVGEV